MMVLLTLYSVAFSVLRPLIKIVAFLVPKLALQLKGRPEIAEIAADLAVARAKYRHCAVFFCSSAGEFEQARPIISRLQSLQDTYVQVIFFSKSGIDYVKARGETVPSMLTPITDSIWQWGWLFSALLPTLTCVVRHELWPGFLFIARRFGRLYLIDASNSQGEKNSRFWGFIRGRLLQNFDHIFAVSQFDFNYFTSACRLPASRVTVTSDTKYDRAVERARARPDIIASLGQQFEKLAPTGSNRRLVIGSAYLEEIDLVIGALRANKELLQSWQIIIVPHHLKIANIDAISAKIENEGYRPLRYSSIDDKVQPARFLIVDKMGMLAEIYGTADAALVGGALHHQVHNVLEPASHGLAIAFGPFYKNSQEATHLVELGLANVVSDGHEFSSWWQGLEHSGKRQLMLDATDKLTGAADLIIAKWRQQMDR
jgi:3-deoxy-D-manno-octulosonic-acid transferase